MSKSLRAWTESDVEEARDLEISDLPRHPVSGDPERQARSDTRARRIPSASA